MLSTLPQVSTTIQTHGNGRAVRTTSSPTPLPLQREQHLVFCPLPKTTNLMLRAESLVSMVPAIHGFGVAPDDGTVGFSLLVGRLLHGQIEIQRKNEWTRTLDCRSW